MRTHYGDLQTAIRMGRDVSSGNESVAGSARNKEQTVPSQYARRCRIVFVHEPGTREWRSLRRFAVIRLAHLVGAAERQIFIAPRCLVALDLVRHVEVVIRCSWQPHRSLRGHRLKRHGPLSWIAKNHLELPTIDQEVAECVRDVVKNPFLRRVDVHLRANAYDLSNI